MKYKEYHDNIQKFLDRLHPIYAFSKEEFDKKYQKVITDNPELKGQKMVSLSSCCGCWFKTELESLGKYKKAQLADLRKCYLENPKELYKAIVYEMANTEFCFSGNDKAIMETVGVTKEFLKAHGFITLYMDARQKYLSECGEF